MLVKCLTNCKWGGSNAPRYVCEKGKEIEIDDSLKSQAIASGLFEIVEKPKEVKAKKEAKEDDK